MPVCGIPARGTAACLAVVWLCFGCGVGSDGTQVVTNSELRAIGVSNDSHSDDRSDELFDPSRLLRIDITMDPADYDILRLEGRSFPGVFSGCWNNFDGYSHFSATVAVDGEVLEDVDIRKKGFLGSLSTSRPSIKLNFDKFDPGRRLLDLQRLTINNDRQDLSHSHQCITYQMFRDAGLPAPRCNFARVSINGEDLGIYTNVESIKKHFLRRNFDGSDEGNLYEAQVGDFGQFTKENLELKTNVELDDRSDLDAVVQALQASDENLPDMLGQGLCGAIPRLRHVCLTSPNTGIDTMPVCCSYLIGSRTKLRCGQLLSHGREPQIQKGSCSIGQATGRQRCVGTRGPIQLSRRSSAWIRIDRVGNHPRHQLLLRLEHQGDAPLPAS